MVKIPEALNFIPSTTGVQSVVNFAWYIIIGLIVAAIFGIFLYKLYQAMTYNYRVIVYKKIGDTEIVSEQAAKQTKLNDNYMFHYKGINKYSPVIDSQYMRIVQKSHLFGLMKRSYLGFSVLLDGVTIFPIKVQHNPGLTPINIDQFNYMQSRLKASQQKYVRTNQFIQMLPYVGLGAVVIMFIIGMIFYTKHIETISAQILGAASNQAGQILESGGVQQILQ